MICPLDRQPCTWDHSQDCYQNCINQREEELAIKRAEELQKGK